jgi:hypothetical protein
MEVLENGASILESNMTLRINMVMANVISSTSVNYDFGVLTNLPALTSE